jgi:hypothetical protein
MAALCANGVDGRVQVAEDLIATFGGLEVNGVLTLVGESAGKISPTCAINQQSYSYMPIRPEIDSTMSYTKWSSARDWDLGWLHVPSPDAGLSLDDRLLVR